MTAELPDTHDSSPAPAPLALKSDEGLGPLLEKALVDFGVACRYGDTAARQATAETIREAARAGVAAERERCAKLCEQEHRESGEHPEMALHCAERIRGLRA